MLDKSQPKTQNFVKLRGTDSCHFLNGAVGMHHIEDLVVLFGLVACKTRGNAQEDTVLDRMLV